MPLRRRILSKSPIQRLWDHRVLTVQRNLLWDNQALLSNWCIGMLRRRAVFCGGGVHSVSDVRSRDVWLWWYHKLHSMSSEYLQYSWGLYRLPCQHMVCRWRIGLLQQLISDLCHSI